jgi:hypothetical protein
MQDLQGPHSISGGSTLPHVPQRSAILLALLVLCLFGILQSSTAWWLDRNELPDGFQNEYEHSYTLTEIYFRVRDVGWAEAWTPLWSGYYPPLNHAVASAGMAVVGRSHPAAVLSLGLFLLILLGSGAALGRGLRDASTGAVAAGLLASYPSIFGNARRYEPNVALSGMVAAALAVLILRGGLDRRRTAVFFGLLCGLGMMTDRVVFAVYLVPATAVLLWRGLQGADRGRVVRSWALAVAVALLVCGYFYAVWIRVHVWEVWTQLGTEITAGGEQSQSLPVWTVRGLLYYPLSFLDAQMGLVPGALTLAGLGVYLARGRAHVSFERRRLLEATAFGGLLIVTLIGKKQPFYSVPLLMPVAVVAALGWRSIPRAWIRGVLVCVLIVAGAQQLTFLTRGEGIAPTPGRWAYLAGASPFPPRFLGYEYTQAWAPREQEIGLERAADLCAAERSEKQPLVVLFSDAHAAYEGQVMPTARLLLDTLDVEGVTMSPEAVADRHHEAACFIYMTDGDASWPSGDSVQAHWDTWGIGEVPEPTRQALGAMQTRARQIGSWRGEPEGRVLVYGIDRP